MQQINNPFFWFTAVPEAGYWLFETGKVLGWLGVGLCVRYDGNPSPGRKADAVLTLALFFRGRPIAYKYITW
jgi:hypothetical protein